MGNSVGHWEGDTLVIESTNLSEKVPSFGPNPSSALGTDKTARLTERLSRLSEGTLLYEFTVDDPAILTGSVTAALPMRKLDVPIFEYACHEGNYGMINLLTGARAEEGRSSLGWGRVRLRLCVAEWADDQPPAELSRIPIPVRQHWTRGEALPSLRPEPSRY